ncbi:hypothetical protein NUACC26_036600 [Scytonema sp. NUACC26]
MFALTLAAIPDILHLHPRRVRLYKRTVTSRLEFLVFGVVEKNTYLLKTQKLSINTLVQDVRYFLFEFNFY